MKTPLRFQTKPTVFHIFSQCHSRWKRKNKYRQYKHTITKLKAENKRLKEQKAIMSVMMRSIASTHENLMCALRELCDEIHERTRL